MALPKELPVNPLIELTDEARKHALTMRKELDLADKHLDMIEGLEIDISKLRSKVEWGRKVLDVVEKTMK